MNERFIDLSKFDVEINHEQDNRFDDIINYLSTILNDRTIPEANKQLVRKQFNEIMRVKNITSKPPTVILSPKNDKGVF